jgi:repressor LexA
MDDLTPKARTVLGFLESYYADHSCPPTMREIGAGCGIKSTRSVSDYLKLLERAGRIRRRGGRSRGIELVTSPSSATPPSIRYESVPVLGRIAAGLPLGADATSDESLELNSQTVFGADGCFALKVVGDSMVERHIVEGDMAVIRPQPMANNGEVVAVDIDGEVTLKVFHKEPDRVVLLPANEAYSPIILDGSEGPIRVLGVMVGLVRAA